MSIKKYPHLYLSNQTCFAAYAVARQITQAYHPLLKLLGLTYPQYLVMLVLWEAMENNQQWLKVGDICDELMLDTGTITPLLKRMETSGSIVRQRSESDERIVLVGLTEQGMSLRELASTVPSNLMCRAGVSIDEAASLRDHLWGWIKCWQKAKNQS
jgi:DNA-binding MarR family transcriptional regulator